MAMSRSLGLRSFTTSPADQNIAGSGCVQAGDDVKQRGFAAARWPDQNQEFARLDFQVDVLQHLDAAEDLATFLTTSEDMSDSNPLTAPAVRPRMKYLPATM